MVIRNEYYLVDAKTYATFKECQKKIKELQRRIEELLKYKPLPHAVELGKQSLESEAEPELSNEDSKKEPNELEKEGAGRGPAVEADDFERRFIELYNRLQNSKNQIGSGALDLTPQLPDSNQRADDSVNLVPKEPLPSTSSAAPDTDVDASETDPEFSETDDDADLTDVETNSDKLGEPEQHLDETVLNQIPKSQHSKAKELFNELKHHSEDLSVDSDGKIILFKTPIPDSNFFEVFPLLFRARKFSAHIPYFKDFVNEIASLGLGHLIFRDHTKSYNPRGKNLFKDRSVIRSQIKNNSRWYYLGN